MVKIVRLGAVALSAVALLAASSNAQPGGLRQLQYDNNANAIISFLIDPSSAPQGIADNFQSNMEGIQPAFENLFTAIGQGGAFGTHPKDPPSDSDSAADSVPVSASDPGLA